LLPWSALLLAACSLVACGGETPSAPTATASAPLLWEVVGNGAHAYLFGTMHVSDPRVTKLHPDVEAAFASADAFYTEAGEATATAGARMTQAGSLPQDLSLRGILPPRTWQELDSYLKSRDFGDASALDRFRPWFVSLQLAQIDALPLLKHGQALDFALTARAKQDGKEIGAVETLDEQIAALSVGDMEEQVHMLDITLEKLRAEQASGITSVQKLLDLYVAGDPDAIWAFAMEEVDTSDPVQDRAWRALTTSRNRVMTARIHAKLKSSAGRTFMFAFGSLHFCGPDSVVEGLRALGYEVELIRAG
jgi:uncharacterized protein YbaP (TraB family)